MRPIKQMPQEELFPFVKMEALIPENHILRQINRDVDFSFIDELVDCTYSEDTGRPAADPELMVRILLLGYMYALSERKLFEELNMHAAYRWFCGLGFSDKVPDRSTLNRLRNHRWARDGIFEKILKHIVEQCVKAGLVSGKHLAVDGTQVRANASIKSLEPIVVEVEVDDYLDQLKLKGNYKTPKNRGSHPQDKNFRGSKLSNETHRSKTDPDARLYKKSPGQEASLSYIGNTLIVRLPGNPTTGYLWECTQPLTEGILQPVGEVEFQSEPAPSGMVGVSGAFIFRFRISLMIWIRAHSRQ